MKLDGAKCPICTEGRLAKHVGEFTMEYKGGFISLTDHVSYLCPSCGEGFSAGGENAKSDKAFLDFKRNVDGLLRPSDIRTLRSELELTQAQFAYLLGVGEKTFARYETGKVEQGRAMNSLLKVLRDYPETRQAILGVAAATRGTRLVVHVRQTMQPARAHYAHRIPFVSHEPTNPVCSCSLG